MKQLLINLRILDADGTVSLTSILMAVAIVKFALASPMDSATMVALLGAAATYTGKKVVGKMGQSDDTSEALASQATELQALKNKMAVVEARTAPARR